MSVTQPKIIDVIGVSKDDGRVVLSIIDPLPFDGGERLLVLQSKINDYLDFIDSGQIAETHPEAMSNQIEIHVWFRFDPDHGAMSFLRAAKEALQEIEVLFSYTYHPQLTSEGDA